LWLQSGLAFVDTSTSNVPISSPCHGLVQKAIKQKAIKLVM